MGNSMDEQSLTEAMPELPEPPPAVLSAWDSRLRTLWAASLGTALEAAEALYAPDGSDAAEIRPQVEEYVAAEFWRVLTARQPNMPEMPEARYFGVIAAVWRVHRTVRQSPAFPFVEEYLAVALRPVRRLHAGIMSAEVCTALYDFHRGWWANLTKPQRYIIQVALAKTLAALPPDELGVFWQNLQSSETMMRQAMLLGLEYMRSEHAVPHLLYGLQTSPDHTTRAAIVDCLEQIGDPRAIAPLMQMRRDTALSDWTLSRHIARVLRVIEMHNRDGQHQTLLRPSTTPPEPGSSLLRPAADTPENVQRQEAERDRLLRPAEPPDE